MSISSEITRLSGNVSSALTAISNKGVTVPSGSNSDDLATLIGSIDISGSDFVVEITYSSELNKPVPDKTYSEITSAVSAGKTIVITVDPNLTANAVEGVWDSDYNTLYYSDAFDDGAGVLWNFYYLDSSGIHDDYSYRTYSTDQADATSADVLNGKVFVNASGYHTGSIPTKTSSNLSASGATVTAPAGYYAADATKTIASGTEGTPTATKGTVSNHAVTVTPSVTNTAGYISGGTHTGTGVSVSASELVSGNLAITQNTTTPLDVTNYETVTVTVSSGGIGAVYQDQDGYVVLDDGEPFSQTINITENGDHNVAGYGTAHVTVSGGTPNLQAKTNINPTTSSQTITYDNGYDGLSSVQINAMPSGTAGTPTASKGAVSNHSVSVTPSVTNTTGYITGSTKTGTAVTVSASELVSGTYTVDSSGTKDVTNYASASVPSGTAGTPSATKGTVSNHSVSVTPSVTNSTGWITGSTKTGTAVTVSASELVSGSQTITENGTVDVTNLAEVVVSVSGGGGSGMVVSSATATPSSASSSISFTSLSGEPTSFVITSDADLATGASPYKVATVVFDGTNIFGQTITNTNNAQVTYNSTGLTKSYSNGTLTVSSTVGNFQANQYTLVYTYGGSSANLGTEDVQVGSGATSITFTNLEEEPDYFSCAFKDNFSTSSGYQRVITVVYDGTSTYGLAMDSGAKAQTSWSYSYSNGSLTISSTGTNNGGYFHQPSYYQLTYGYGGEAPQIETEPLSVTENGVYTAPRGKAYTPVTVSVSGGTSKNTQVIQATTRVQSTALAKASGELTVSKTGTYDVYWSTMRSNTSSGYTWGSQLYVGGSAYGSENTSGWSNNVQNIHLQNVSLTADQKIQVYARGRSGSYYAYVPTLVIVEA